MAQESFTFNAEDVIKQGKDGTVILAGRLGNRSIAVKRMDIKNNSLAEKEIALLEKRDVHPSIVRYFGFRQDCNFIYLALELCEGSLIDYVKNRDFQLLLGKNALCLQIVEGLYYLHSLRIVHRNLKPSNILLLAVSDTQMMAKISDYCISKTMDLDRVSFTSSETVGSESYAAPEMLRCDLRRTPKVDVYSLGLVFFFLFSDGQNLDRNWNNWNCVPRGPRKILLSKMLDKNANRRPCARDLLVHPAFWTPDKCLAFLVALSEHAPPNFDLEEHKEEVFCGNWTHKIHSHIITKLSRHRPYCGESLGHLIRAIRNLAHHRTTIPGAEAYIGHTNDSLFLYFQERFPNLIYYAWLTGLPLKKALFRFYDYIPRERDA